MAGELKELTQAIHALAHEVGGLIAVLHERLGVASPIAEYQEPAEAPADDASLEPALDLDAISGLPGGVIPYLVDVDRYRVDLPDGFQFFLMQDEGSIVLVNPSGTVDVLGEDIYGVGEHIAVQPIAGGARSFETEKSRHAGIIESNGVIHLTLCNGQDIVVRFPQGHESLTERFRVED